MDVPRYLFRSHSPNSDGTNSITGFGSMAKSNGNNRIRSLSRMAPAAAHGMLKDHVLWHSWKDRDDDILISFTPSFLFSLQHCVRKINGGRQTTKHNCYITIIDTSRFPLHTFTWTVDLLEQYDLDIKNDPNLLHKYHEAEYVAEYELLIINQEAAKTVSFNELDLRGDLFDIMPELDDEIYKGKLWLRLQQLRRQWYREEKAITSFEVHGARKLALCFGGKWVPPMMLWALAIRARPNQNQMLIHEFREGFYGNIEPQYLFRDESTAIPASLPELTEWQKLMRTAYATQATMIAETRDKAAGGASEDAVDEIAKVLDNLEL